MAAVGAACAELGISRERRDGFLDQSPEQGYRGSLNNSSNRRGHHVIVCRTWLCALALLVAGAPAFAQTPQAAVGRIKIASGSVFIVRGGSPVAAQAGDPIFEADSLRTGADGRL